MADDARQDIGLVKEALDHCAENFRSGVNAHGVPTLVIPNEVVEALKEKLEKFFEKNLTGVDKREWHGPGGDSRRVTRMAFYVGAIAAFHAHAEDVSKLTCQHVNAALAYVREHCTGVSWSEAKKADIVVKPQWIYCDW